MNDGQIKSFRLVVRPGDAKLRSGDYWAIILLCLVGSITLIVMMSQTV